MKNFGIIPAYSMPTKRDILFFDAFISLGAGIPRVADTQMPTRYGMVHFQSSSADEMQASYEYLRSAGLVDQDASSLENLLKEAQAANLNIDSIQEKIHRLERRVDETPYFGHGYMPPLDSGVIPHIQDQARELGLEYRSHVQARLMALLKSDAANTYTPIVMEEQFPALALKSNGAVLQVALKNFPVPSDEVTLQELVEFKQDKKVAQQIALMRRWMRKAISNEKSTPAQVGEEIADSLDDFRQHMQLAHLKYRTEVVQVLVTFPLATIERICKLQFSQLFDPVFAVRKAKIAMLEAELKAPGRELAYLHASLERFGSPET